MGIATEWNAPMDETHRVRAQLDEVWLQAWLRLGFSELESYLAKHAAFDQYCRSHRRPHAA
jgi:hypothetical protein